MGGTRAVWVRFQTKIFSVTVSVVKTTDDILDGLDELAFRKMQRRFRHYNVLRVLGKKFTRSNVTTTRCVTKSWWALHSIVDFSYVSRWASHTIVYLYSDLIPQFRCVRNHWLRCSRLHERCRCKRFFIMYCQQQAMSCTPTSEYVGANFVCNADKNLDPNGVFLNALSESMPECDRRERAVSLDDLADHSARAERPNCYVYCAQRSCNAAQVYMQKHKDDLEAHCATVSYLHGGLWKWIAANSQTAMHVTRRSSSIT